jgi:hypothetical protein
MAIRNDISNVLVELSRKSGVHRGELSRRFHRIKRRGTTPGPRDINWIDDLSGDVYDGPHGKVGTTSGTSLMTSSAATAANPNCTTTFASLRLFGDGLIPDEVSRLLRLAPTEAAPKGFKTLAPSGKTRVAPTGRWILETEGKVSSTDLEQHVAWLLDRLEASGVVPLDIPGVTRADVSCYWLSATGNGGPEFSAELLGRLSRLCLALNLDIYFDQT